MATGRLSHELRPHEAFLAVSVPHEVFFRLTHWPDPILISSNAREPWQSIFCETSSAPELVKITHDTPLN